MPCSSARSEIESRVDFLAGCRAPGPPVRLLTHWRLCCERRPSCRARPKEPASDWFASRSESGNAEGRPQPRSVLVARPFHEGQSLNGRHAGRGNDEPYGERHLLVPRRVSSCRARPNSRSLRSATPRTMRHSPPGTGLRRARHATDNPADPGRHALCAGNPGARTELGKERG